MQHEMRSPRRDACQRRLHRVRIAERKIRAPDGPREHDIADKNHVAADQRHVPRRMPRQVHDAKVVARQRDHIILVPFAIWGRRRFHGDAVGPRLRGHVVVQRTIRRVQPDRCIGKRAAHAGDAADMIEMPMRDPDRLQRDSHGTQACRERIALGAGIDDRGAATLLVDHEIGVGLECTDRHGLDA